MKLTPEMIDARMAAHRKWQDEEAERMTNEIWGSIFGAPAGADMFGDMNRKPQKPRLRRHKAYGDLPEETVRILGRLGK